MAASARKTADIVGTVKGQRAHIAERVISLIHEAAGSMPPTRIELETALGRLHYVVCYRADVPRNAAVTMLSRKRIVVPICEPLHMLEILAHEASEVLLRSADEPMVAPLSQADEYHEVSRLVASQIAEAAVAEIASLDASIAALSTEIDARAATLATHGREMAAVGAALQVHPIGDITLPSITKLPTIIARQHAALQTLADLARRRADFTEYP